MPGIIHRLLKQTKRKCPCSELQSHPRTFLDPSNDRDVVLALVVLEPSRRGRGKAMGILGTELVRCLLATVRGPDGHSGRESSESGIRQSLSHFYPEPGRSVRVEESVPVDDFQQD